MATQDLVQSYIEEQRRAARNEGERRALVTFLTARFGELPPDLVAIVERTDALTLLRRWVQLAAVAPREEIFAAIRGSTSP